MNAAWLRLSSFSALGVATACLPAIAQDTDTQLERLMRKAARAVATVKYSGQRVVELGSGPKRLRTVELILKDGLMIRTEFPENSPFAGQIIVENALERRHYFPERNEIRLLPPRRDEALGRLRRMIEEVRKKGGRVAVEAGGPVAGIRTDRVTLYDGSGNALQRAWFDGATGVVLKRELLDPVGSVVGFFQFSQINYRPVIRPGDFEIRRRGAQVMDAAAQLKEAADQSGLPAFMLPPSSGFRLITVRAMPGMGTPLISQLYSGRLSLIYLRGDIRPQRLERLTRGRANSHVWREGDISLVLVGDQEKQELERLARLVTRN